MPDNYFKKIAKNKVRKGDRVFYTDAYGNKEFGYYVKKQKAHATLDPSSVTPYGVVKGRKYYALWNPHGICSGSGNEANVFLPLSKIEKVVRGYKNKPGKKKANKSLHKFGRKM